LVGQGIKVPRDLRPFGLNLAKFHSFGSRGSTLFLETYSKPGPIFNPISINFGALGKNYS